MSIQFPNLGINLDYVGKSIHIFGFEITFFGLMIALGMLLGLGFIILEAKRCGEDPNSYLELLITSLITGVVGARLFYVCFSWNLYKGNIVQIFNIRNGGLVFYGGLFGGMLGAAIYCTVRRKPFMKMADTVSMGLVIAQIIGRWGDFFNRESFGEYTNTIFAMQLPLSSVSAGEVTSAMRENLETLGGTSYIQVHPAFFYESMWCLLLFLLMLVWKRKKRYQGEVFLRYLAGYGLGRFLIEFLRTDKMLIPGTSIGINQFISAVLFLLCTVVAVVEGTMAKKRAARRRRRREQDYEAQEKASREAEAEEYRSRLRMERAFGEGADSWQKDMESRTPENPEVEEELEKPDDSMEKESEMSPDEAASEPDQVEKSIFKEDPSGKISSEKISSDETPSEEASSKKDTQVSKEDEWLYSGPRRFAKKSDDQSED